MYVLGYRVPLLAILAFFIGIFFAVVARILTKNKAQPFSRSLATIGFAWYLPIVFAITLAPRTSQQVKMARCFTSLSADFSAWAQEDQRMLNVIMFIPIGFLATLVAASKKQLFTALLLVISIPLLIELVQSTSIINRSCDINDGFDNLSGLLLGSILGLFLKLFERYAHDKNV